MGGVNRTLCKKERNCGISIFKILSVIQFGQYNSFVEKNGYINKIHNKFKIRYYYKLNILFSSR